jgi:hypothetical protein
VKAAVTNAQVSAGGVENQLHCEFRIWDCGMLRFAG